jgi:hypothetical protein
MQYKLSKLMIGTLLGAVFLSSAVPALANTVSCSTGRNLGGHCETPPITTNRTGLNLRVAVSDHMRWGIRDARSGQVIAAGATGMQGKTMLLSGRAGTYRGNATNTTRRLLTSGSLTLSTVSVGV